MPRVRIEKRLPLSGIRLSILSRFFGFAFLGTWPKVFFLFCTYCAFSAEGFWFGPFERSGRLGVQFALVPLSAEGFFSFCTYCAFSAEGFWFGPFGRSKLLGICFALVVRLCRRFFDSDLLEGRNPLAFV